MIGRKKRSYIADGKEMSSVADVGTTRFTSAQLSTPVKDLRRAEAALQLMLILLDEPNVLILDEPSNDLDTDMLAAMEDLLDTWPGTLLVVSHDRYLMERVTDQQYAVIDGSFRHLPGGVDEYLALSAAGRAVLPLVLRAVHPPQRKRTILRFLVAKLNQRTLALRARRKYRGHRHARHRRNPPRLSVASENWARNRASSPSR